MNVFKLKMLLMELDDYSNVHLVTSEGMKEIVRIELLNVEKVYPSKEAIETTVLLYSGDEQNVNQNQEG